MITLFEFFVLALAIVVHELGHYFAFRAFGFKPFVRLRWFGIEVGSWRALMVLPMNRLVHMYAAGVWWGFLPLFLFGAGVELKLLYSLCCCSDIMEIIQYFGLKKEQKPLTAIEVNKILIMEMEEKAKYT